MLPTLIADPVPLRADAHGVLRVGNTRVTVDTVIDAYHEGASAEEVVSRYDSLSLAEVYSVFAYYLRHREELDRYLDERHAASAETRRQVEARQGVQDIRGRLTRRLANQGGTDAVPRG
jgi:uncharacterized protein (DUF433 family)